MVQLHVHDSRRTRTPFVASTKRASWAPRSRQFGDPNDYHGQGAAERRARSPRDQRGQRRQPDRGRAQASGSGGSGEGRAPEAVGGSRVGSELQTKAITAILISFVVTLIYLAFRFEWRFGVAAIAATAHDILTTMAFLSHDAPRDLAHGRRRDPDRHRILAQRHDHHLRSRARESEEQRERNQLREVLNRSINETLPRSILTHATVFAATLALLFFAGEVIRPFSWLMAFGVFTGTFSSIYVAGPILLWIEHKWPRATSTENKGTSRALAEDRRRERRDPVGRRADS